MHIGLRGLAQRGAETEPLPCASFLQRAEWLASRIHFAASRPPQRYDAPLCLSLAKTSRWRNYVEEVHPDDSGAVWDAFCCNGFAGRPKREAERKRQRESRSHGREATFRQ